MPCCNCLGKILIIEDGALQQCHMLQRFGRTVISREVDRRLAPGNGQRGLRRDGLRQFHRVSEQRIGIRQHGIYQADCQRTIGAQPLTGVGHLPSHAGGNDLREALQHTEVSRHTDLGFLKCEECISRTSPYVAGDGEIEASADAATLNRADDGKPDLIERIDAIHQISQRVLEAQPGPRTAVVKHIRRASEHLERHAGRKVLSGGTDDKDTGVARVIERQHGVAQSGEKGQAHRIEPVGPVQLEMRDAGFVTNAKVFVMHG